MGVLIRQIISTKINSVFNFFKVYAKGKINWLFVRNAFRQFHYFITSMIFVNNFYNEIRERKIIIYNDQGKWKKTKKNKKVI